MPHAVIEYSDNISALMVQKKISEVVHGVMISYGLFETANIKTRTHATDDFLVGDKGGEGSFVHLCISILAGRTVEQRQELSHVMVEVLRGQLVGVDQVTVEIREMDKKTYAKVV